MTLGEIYLWETDRAQGHAKRKKFHIFICQNEENHFSLYINSIEYYKDCKILRANYEFLAYDSFIGCNAVETYTTKQLAVLKPQPQIIGQLTAQDMKALRDAIIAAETMEARNANRVCKALAEIL